MSINGKFQQTTGWSEVHVGGDYSEEERQFLVAIDRYRSSQRRPFPTARELLGVVKSLGYRRPDFSDAPPVEPVEVKPRHRGRARQPKQTHQADQA
jgi:hypothetical protein